MEVTKEKAVVCLVNEPSPIAFLNVYEEGDVWVKIQGCEACPPKNRKICCGNCPFVYEKGCFWHITEGGNSKPFFCVVRPTPDTCLSWCYLEFKCIKGSKEGKIRRVKDRGNVFD